MLVPEIRKGLIAVTSRQNILAGEITAAEIQKNFEAASVIALLLSSDYLASEEHYNEALRAINRPDRGHILIVAIKVRPCLECDLLTRADCVLPSNGCEVLQWSNRDAALHDVAKGLCAVARSVWDKTGATVPPTVPLEPLIPQDLVAESLFEPSLLHPLALACNRSAQWGKLNGLFADTTRDDLILLPGELDQGHDYFSDRVVRALRREPAHRIVTVHWDSSPFPSCPKEYHDRLAQALGCERVKLVQQICKTLRHSNLLLLHQTVTDHFPAGDDEEKKALLLFNEWLPRLIEESRSYDQQAPRGNAATHAVKCLQPIAWCCISAFKRALAIALTRPLGPRLPCAKLDNWLHSYRAKRFMDLLSNMQGMLAVHCLPELVDISDDDLRDVCKQARIPERRWPQLIVDTRRHGRDPKTLLLSLSRTLRNPVMRTMP